jgi:hypothetical protein
MEEKVRSGYVSYKILLGAMILQHLLAADQNHVSCGHYTLPLNSGSAVFHELKNYILVKNYNMQVQLY